MAVDMWAWVEQLEQDLREAGQDHLASLLNDLPSASHNGESARVEAMVPEALAAARAMKNPWMEVYIRHWGLNNRVSNQAEGEKALAEAVSLLEFSHREQTQDCPQSICATQDIAMCYRGMDGPGWAPECLAVCEETLARTPPEQNCFQCLSFEYALALVDSNRAAEAVTYLERQKQRFIEAGRESDTADWSFCHTRATVLAAAGRPQEALELLRACDEAQYEYDDDDSRLDRQILTAQILAEQGRLEEAWDKLPDFGSRVSPGKFSSWSTTMEILAQGNPERNNWQLGRLFARMSSYLGDVGAHRKCINMALRTARLALDRGARWSAARSLDLARRHLPKLRMDGGAAAAIEAVQARLDQAGAAPVTLPVPAEQIAALVRERNDSPESDLELLLAARQLRPDDEELVLMTAQAMQAAGAREQAVDCLWQYARGHAYPENVVAHLLGLLLEGSDAADQVAQLARELESVHPDLAHFCRMRLAYQQSHWRTVAQEAEAMLKLRPDAGSARRHWAAAAMAEEDFARAVALYKELVETSEKPGGDDWELMTAASAAGDWAAVRHSAQRLGMKLSSAEGPIDEEWGAVYLAFQEGGETRTYTGLRTGPVTARILAVAPVKYRQHVHDEVVFNASPLSPEPEDEEERKRWRPTFRVVHVTRHADYRSWFVDGAYPGEEPLNALRGALEAEGWAIWFYSPDDYTVRNPAGEDQDPLPGIYGWLAAPASVAPATIDARLREWTAGWQHPLCWLHVAREAGVDVERHEGIMEKYGL